ncbi:unnamed protein product, partial [Ectocarpus sp. 13 AM-2016]
MKPVVGGTSDTRGYAAHRCLSYSNANNKEELNHARTRHHPWQLRLAPFHGPASLSGRCYTNYTHVVVVMVQDGVEASHKHFRRSGFVIHLLEVQSTHVLV